MNLNTKKKLRWHLTNWIAEINNRLILLHNMKGINLEDRGSTGLIGYADSLRVRIRDEIRALDEEIEKDETDNSKSKS